MVRSRGAPAGMTAARAVAVVALLLLVTAMRVAAGQPGYGLGFLALVPIVLAAFWFGPAAAWATVAGAVALYLGTELISRSPTFTAADLWTAALIRTLVYVGGAALVNALLARERAAAGDAADEAARVRVAEAGRGVADAAAARLASMIDGLGAGVWERDAQSWQVTFVNDRVVALLGRPPAGWEADPGLWVALLHPEDREAAIAAVRDGTAAGADFEAGYRMIAQDGRVVRVRDIVHVVPGPDGAPRSLQSVLIDITEQTRREQAAQLLAEAGRVLAGPGPVTDRLSAVAELVVGELSDVAIIRLADQDGHFRAVAAAPAENAAAVGAWPPVTMPDDMRRAFRTGRAFVVPERTDEMMRASCRDEAEFRALVAVLGHGSSLVVPLVIDGQDVGSFSLTAHRPRDYDAADVALGEDLGHRIAAVLAAERVTTRQRQLQRVTAALAAAEGVEVVAGALLDGLIDVFGASGVAAFVLDPDSGALRVVAAVGYPGQMVERLATIRLDDALPVSDCARDGEPVWLSGDAEWSRRYPHRAGARAGLGHRAALALPMRIGNRVVGVLGASFAADRDFTSDEREFAMTLAGQAAQAFRRAAEADQRRGIAEALQRSLLPPALPRLDRVDLAAHYQPAATGTEAGGDWYDVLRVDEGRVAVVVGDVVGQGPAAAAVMGQLRSALAAYLIDGYGPAEALERLSRFARRVPGATASTVVCLVLDPASGRLSWARAGHPPPLLLSTDGVAYLQDATGAVLGLDADVPFRSGEAVLEPGWTVVLYTDGLVERRGEVIDDGLDRLAAATIGRAGLLPARLLPEVLDRALGATGPPDDVAVVVVRLLPPPLCLRLPARPHELRRLRAAVQGWAAAHGLDDALVDDLQLALGEAAANAVEHAYGDARSGEIAVRLTRSATGVRVEVADTGTWRPVPADPGYRGRGLAVIRALGAAVDVDTAGPGTRVRFTLPVPGDGEPELTASPARLQERVDILALTGLDRAVEPRLVPEP